MKGKYTDLQLTMVQILEDKGISMHDELNQSVVLGRDFINITRSSGTSRERTLKTFSVKIDEMFEQIVLKDHVCNSGFDSNNGVYHWWSYTHDIVENYQVIDNQMHYSEIKKVVGMDSLDSEDSKLIDSDQSTAVYELPEGYKITDGIFCFSDFTHRKASIYNKSI